MEEERLVNEIAIIRQLLQEFLSSQKTVEIIIEGVKHHINKTSSLESKAELFYKKIGHYGKFEKDSISVYRLLEDIVNLVGSENDSDRALLQEMIHDIYEEFAGMGIPYTSFPGVMMTGIQYVNEIRESPSSEKFILNSLLISNVALFENFIRKIFIFLFNNNTNLITGTDKIFTINDVLQFETIGEARQSIIENKIDKLMRQDISSWSDHFKKAAKSNLRWCDDRLVEIFKRRNAFVHTDGLVNENYLDFINKSSSFKNKLEINDRLDFNQEYLLDAVNKMAKSAMIISLSTAEYMLKEYPSLINQNILELGELGLANLSHDLLRENRHKAVLGLYDIVNPILRRNSTREVLKVNDLCAQREIYGMDSRFIKSVKDWDVSALSENYKLVKLVFENKMEEALEFFVQLEQRMTITHNELVTWEALKPLRDYVKNKPGSYNSPFQVDLEEGMG